MNVLIASVTLVAAALLPVTLAAQDVSNAVAGKRLYRSYCLACHGVDGRQRGPLAEKLNLQPADLTAATYQSKGADELAALAAGYGRSPGTDMPMWGAVLPKNDLRDIAAYLGVLASGDLRYRGDTRRGRAVFRSMCIACHGRFGTGNGILAHVIGVPMVDFTSSGSLATLSDDQLVATIRNGRGEFMPAWRDLLNESEIFDVAWYVRTLPAMALTVKRAESKAANPVAGGRIYRAYCVVCHGQDGRSVGPLARKRGYAPADLTSPALATKTIDDLAAIIGGYGRPAVTNMPRWSAVLPDEALRDVAAYVTVIGDPAVITAGDARRGRAVFKSTCISCHGPGGQGDGILARLIEAPMTDFTDPERMRALTDAALMISVRDGKGQFMPSWKEVLSEREITDVVTYVRGLPR
jgi:cbb3-type cytochrome c oxidase subunit III